IFAAPWLAIPEISPVLRAGSPSWWKSTPSFRKTLLAGLFVAISILFSIPVKRLLGNNGNDPDKSLSRGTPWMQAMAVESPKLVPDTALAKAIANTYPNGRFTGAIFAQDVLGDFFVWRLPTPVPVFIYSHVHLFSPARWREYTMIRDLQSGMETRLDS